MNLAYLPSELLWEVFNEIELSDAKAVTLVCKRWNDQFWKGRREVSLNKNTLNNQTAAFLSKECQQLRSLTISHSTHLSEKKIRALLPSSEGLILFLNNCQSTLETVILEECPLISDKGIQFLTRCHKLKKLVLRRMLGITNQALITLSNSLPPLEAVDLTCPEIPPSVLKKLISACKSMKEVNFRNAFHFEDETLATTFEEQSMMTSKDFRMEKFTLSSSFVGDSVLSSFLQMYSNTLTELNLHRTLSITYRSSLAISSLTRLKKLCLQSCREMKTLGLQNIVTACTQLTHLDLSFCRVDDNIIRCITTHLTRLSDLNLRGCEKITDNSMRGLLAALPLKSINLYNCTGLSDKSFSLSSQPSTTSPSSSSSSSSSSPSLQLEVVNLVFVDIRGPTFTSLGRNVREVHLDRNQHINSSSVLSLLLHSPLLSTLSLNWCHNVNDEVLLHVADHAPSLRHLCLNGCPITDEGIKSLSKCHRLSTLLIGQCHQITDQAISYLSQGCPKLERLDMWCENLTNQSLFSLGKGCPKLLKVQMGWVEGVDYRGINYLFDKCQFLVKIEWRAQEIIEPLNIEQTSLFQRYNNISLYQWMAAACLLVSLTLTACLSGSLFNYSE